MIFSCIYLDESGHSGRRFWDINQPFYIEGGWSIDRERLEDVGKIIEEIESHYFPKTAELKGKYLVKHAKGRKLILQIIKSIGLSSAVPLLYIIEKKFFVCGKIVETFLDPAYNSSVSYSDQADLLERQRIANVIYGIGSPLIQEFAEAYRQRNCLAIKLIALKWAGELEIAGHHDISELFRKGADTSGEALLAETSFNEEPALRNADTMNLTSWFYLFQHLEQNVPGDCLIIHDHIHTFEESYLSLFNMLKGAMKSEVRFADRRIVLPLKKIKRLTFEDSRLNPIIRAADMLVGSAQFYIKEALNGQSVTADVHKIGIIVLGIYLLWTMPASLGRPPILGTLVASDHFIGRLMSTLKEHVDLLETLGSD